MSSTDIYIYTHTGDLELNAVDNTKYAVQKPTLHEKKLSDHNRAILNTALVYTHTYAKNHTSDKMCASSS